MTRPALSLALLLAAAPALAQTAPPSAADSALVERYLDLSFASAEPARQMFADAPGPGGAVLDLALDATTRDSVRAAFYADLRPALLAEAVAFTEGPLFARAQRAAAPLTDSLSFAEVQAVLDDPGDRPLADSALAARYAAATLAASQPPEAQERIFGAVLEALPADVVEAAGGADGFRAMFEGMTRSDAMRALQLGAMTRAARLSMAPLSEADARALVAYTESEAAQYAGRTAAVGAANAMAPQMAEVMASSLADPPTPPPPPSPPPARDGVYEVAEVQPELVGGLDGLMARVVYPETARAEGVEGQAVVQFVVDEGGAVRDPVVLRSPDPRLSEAAVAAVRASRFRPGRVGGEPVPVRFALPVTFRLVDDPGPFEGVDGFRAEYPDGAWADGVGGRVVVAFAVDGAGRAVRPEVVASPDDRLAAAALGAVRGARFALRPGRADDRVELPVLFLIRPLPSGGLGSLAYAVPGTAVGAGGVLDVTETAPELVGGLRGLQVRVEYPETARRGGIQGTVQVSFVVGPDGSVRDPEVVQSPHRLLSRAALRAVRRSTFTPATANGRAVGARLTVPVRFRLR